MFYYYGRKKQIAKYYPAPNCETIIEPFAGSAAYSLHGDNWRKKVILIDKDPSVAELWQWFIEDATISDINKMPDLHIGDRSSQFLHIIHAATKMAFKFKCIKVTPVLERNWEISKRVFADNLYKIKHWKIICGDYTEAPDIEATWFIDPPYKGDSGMGYRYGSNLIDYNELANWVKSRKGEVIFCEGENGDYLPFKPLMSLKGVAGKTSQEKTFYFSHIQKHSDDPNSVDTRLVLTRRVIEWRQKKNKQSGYMSKERRRHDVSDSVWAKIESYFPGQAGQWGGVAADNRRFFNGVCWILRTGAPWRHLPSEYGKWGSVHKRFKRFCDKGTWDNILERVIDEPDFKWLMPDTAHCKPRPRAVGGNQDMERTNQEKLCHSTGY